MLSTNLKKSALILLFILITDSIHILCALAFFLLNYPEGFSLQYVMVTSLLFFSYAFMYFKLASHPAYVALFTCTCVCA